MAWVWVTCLLLHSTGRAQPVRQRYVRIVRVVGGLRDYVGHAGRIAAGHGDGGNGEALEASAVQQRSGP